MLKQHFKQPFRKYMYGSRFFSDLLTGTMRSLIEPVVSGCLVLLLSSVFFVVVVVVVVVLVVITVTYVIVTVSPEWSPDGRT